MAKVSITSIPKKRVSNPSLKRKEGTFRVIAKWKVGSAVSTPTSASRATSLDIQWRVIRGKKKLLATKTIVGVPIGTTTASFNPLNFTDDKGKEWTKKDYYPNKGKPELVKVSVRVYGRNDKGRSKVFVSRAIEWADPGKPTITPLEHDRDSGEIFFTITAFDGKKKNAPRTRTDYSIHILDTRLAKAKQESTRTGSFTGDSQKWDETTKENSKVIVDVKDRYILGYDQYVKVTIKAHSISATGRSDDVSRWIILAYPNAATIGTPSIDKNAEGKVDNSGKVVIPIKTNTDYKTRPTTGVRLQKLRSVAAASPAQATAMGESWEDTDAVDDGECVGLALSVAETMPTRGTHTWVRVKSWNTHEDLFYRYSEPMELKDLYEDPASAQGNVVITSLTSGDDGTSLIADLAWNVGSDPETGTEISWSDDENAWKSTKEPEKYEFTRSDGAVTIGDVEYGGSARVYIQGLTQGTLYYVRARRYIETEDGNSYGGYSNTMSGTPSSSPQSVELNCPTTLARGTSLSLSWTFTARTKTTGKSRTGNPRYASSSNNTRFSSMTSTRQAVTQDDDTAVQKEWYLLYGTEYVEEEVDGVPKRNYTINETPWVDNGDDALGSCVVPWAKLEPLLDENGEVALALRMGTGGSLVTSEPVALRVVDPPVVTLDVPAILTKQPATFGVTCNVPASMSVIVRAGSLSVDGEMIGGNSGDDVVHDDQTAGDVVWQSSAVPDWTDADGSYTATLSTPDGANIAEFLDNGTYTVFVQPTDVQTGLVGQTVTAEFDVAWKDQAPRMLNGEEEAPVEVIPSDTTDESGVRTRSCTIQLAPPQGALGTETYNVYRVTPDGEYLIAERCGLTERVVDAYAPFGGSEIAYRVAVVTVDGDTDWLDYGYSLPGRDMRIDFGSEYVELPYDLSLSDSYQKDFEARRKLDGSIDGYWNDGVQRTGNYSSNLIRIYDEEKAATVRRLAQYAGPVFVRTPDGCAYQADVEISNFGGARRDAALAVSIDATEVALTEEFMADLPDRHSEEDPDDDGEEG